MLLSGGKKASSVGTLLFSIDPFFIKKSLGMPRSFLYFFHNKNIILLIKSTKLRVVD